MCGLWVVLCLIYSILFVLFRPIRVVAIGVRRFVGVRWLGVFGLSLCL